MSSRRQFGSCTDNLGSQGTEKPLVSRLSGSLLDRGWGPHRASVALFHHSGQEVALG